MGKVKSPAGAILMKFCTLDLFLTRNQMEQVSDPEKDPLGVVLGVKGQYGQKNIIDVKYLFGKLMTSAIDLRQLTFILTNPWGSFWGSKVGS